MLVSMLEIMKKAKEGGYGVLAPNVYLMRIQSEPALKQQ